MPLIQRSVIVPFSAKKMFDLVNDIERYPDFLHWCSKAVILRNDGDMIEATLTLTKGALQKEFTTQNRMQKNKMIEIRLVNGPFHLLEGFWRFEALSDTSAEIAFDLEFEFINRIVGFAMEPIFHPIANTLVDAFVERAHDVYRQEEDG